MQGRAGRNHMANRASAVKLSCAVTPSHWSVRRWYVWVVVKLPFTLVWQLVVYSIAGQSKGKHSAPSRHPWPPQQGPANLTPTSRTSDVDHFAFTKHRHGSMSIHCTP